MAQALANPFNPAIVMVNARHERFCVLMIVGNVPQYACYIEAGFNSKDLTTARGNAGKLMMREDVRSRIAWLRQDAAEREGVTVESHLSNLGRLRHKAEGGEAYGAATRAEELRGRVAGLYIDRLLVESAVDEVDEGQVIEEIAKNPLLVAKINDAAKKYMIDDKKESSDI
jgi:hypothetical protein